MKVIVSSVEKDTMEKSKIEVVFDKAILAQSGHTIVVKDINSVDILGIFQLGDFYAYTESK